jgi:phenylalanine ammonia-lyase
VKYISHLLNSRCSHIDIYFSSLALISARATINSLGVLSILISSYLYALCQGLTLYLPILSCLTNFITLALDLRSLQHEFHEGLTKISSEEISAAFGSMLSENDATIIKAKVGSVLHDKFDSTSTMDADERMQEVAASSTTPLLDFFTGPSFSDPSLVGPALTSIPAFRSRVSSRAYSLLDGLRKDYLSGARGAAPASRYLNRTRPVYEFVRLTLGIRMHGSENYHRFVNGLGVDDVTIGQNVSLIHEVRFVLLS